MNQSIELGRMNRLKIQRHEPHGMYLVAKDDDYVLLPNAYVSVSMKIDDEIDVFVYTDSEDRYVATTIEPDVMRSEFGYLEVVDVVPFGAFCNWGLPKDLFVPKGMQKTPFKVGQKRVVRVVHDKESDRLIGVEKFGQYLSKQRPDFEVNQQVKLFILAKTPLGFKAIINNRFEGMLFKNEIFESLEIGQRKVGYVKQVRSDGKIDLALQPVGADASSAAAEAKVMQVLRENDYHIPYNYKTDPEVINNVFGLSKKAFKRTLTALQEKKAISVSDEGISFLNS